MGDILNEIPDCDAVFCNNDDLALGAAFECQRRNISIPQQMGICGFNDLGIVSEMYPSVTSVYTPRFKIGKQAVEMAIRAGKEELTTPERIVELHAELRVRTSTSPKR